MNQDRTNRRYQYVIRMIEASAYEDIALLEGFRSEDPWRKKSLYYQIRCASVCSDLADPAMNHQKAYRILMDAVSEYLRAYSAPAVMKQKLYERLQNWCKHIGEQFQIPDFQIYLDDLHPPFSADLTA